MMKTSDLQIIYEDNHLIVIVKPANILSQKDYTNDIDITDIVKDYLKEKYQKPGNVYLGLVHRLDRRVSGVMVFAKTSKAAARLSESIREQVINKKYYAIVCGFVKESKSLKHYLEKVKTKEGYLAVVSENKSKNSKEAILNFKVLKNFIIEESKFSLLEIELITGRYNQIRAQLSHINHPIINDFKYGYKLKKFSDELGLACVEMEIIHPISKELLKFTHIPNGGLWTSVDGGLR